MIKAVHGGNTVFYGTPTFRDVCIVIEPMTNN
jgi:hypothetical protein